ncbi:uncharacterized protein LOC122367378 [Amphibalanus amphitrite]|uniref:uncharacterized protein LOC122367378 n=1 Tax=Amphibalanus amphitrite TaxID=1232801 RepID=UPI001C927415|nr:uncharacterized protein LOC122367378 [Amphibalanus amphitrite]
MELQSAVKLLIVGQALTLAAVAGEEVFDSETNITSITYSASELRPILFDVGDDSIKVNLQGCTHRNNLVCCFNRPMLENLPAPRLCSSFLSASCCYMLPGRDKYPRLPADLVPLLPTLTQSGQCEQRRRGRRVLHCCRGAEPSDPNPSGRAARICSDVGDMRCCYHPFAGHRMTSVLQAAEDEFRGVFGVKLVNHAPPRGDRLAYTIDRLRKLRARTQAARDIIG